MKNAPPLVAVTGSQRPYVYDLPHLLALPDGFEFRFRYRHQWVEETIRRSLSTSNEHHQGRELILLFYSQETKRIIPLRRCTIIGLEDLGPMVFVHFRLGPFAAVDPEVLATVDWSASRAAGAQLQALGANLLGLERDEAMRAAVESGAPLPAACHLREAAMVSGEHVWTRAPNSASRTKNWASLVSVLLHEPNLVGIPMFHVLGFQAEDGAHVVASQISTDFSLFKERSHGFRLTEGKRYRLRLVEWCEPPRGMHAQSATAGVAFRSEILQLEGSSNLVVGRYDTLEFTFVGGRPGYTEVALRVEPFGERLTAPGGDRTGESPFDAPSAPISDRPSGSVVARPWPSLFAARIPVYVGHNAPRVALVALVGLIGLTLFLKGNSWVGEPYGPALQLAGLFLASTAMGEYLERFVKLGKGIRDFRKDGSSS